MKRLLDVAVALTGLIFLSPLLLVVALLIFREDFRTPFYNPLRMARGSGQFRMLKFRSMRVNADKTGVNSTSADDPRVTPIGSFVRRFKLDEVLQLWNVLKGDMSVVGPRPQIELETSLYTDVEKRMLSVKPGITDPASIVFSDLGDILKQSPDPNLRYNQIVRPWKSRLALGYVEHQTLWVDLKLIGITALGLAARPMALRLLQRVLRSWSLDENLVRVAGRTERLIPWPPPGAVEIVSSYPSPGR
jgi:lipopolysaccharide/colanic/teichoic acid biosynthesis glycosyltransferase